MLKKMISIVPLAALSLTVSANVQAATITVQKGDTLWDLAQTNHTSVESIQLANDLTTDLIHPGDILTIVQQKQYTVSQGDTLWDIAKDYQVSVSQLKEWNQLHTDVIQPDSNLVIYEGLQAKDTTVSKSPKPPVKQASNNSTYTATAPSMNEDLQDRTPDTTASPIQDTEDSTSEAKAPSTNTSSKENTAKTTTVPSPNQEIKEKETEKTTTSTDTDAKEITVEATAYTASCDGCSGVTSTGIDLKANPNAKVISVDPSVIPLGSKVYVEGYGEAIAGDTGGSIKGKRIDVYFSSKQDADNFGVKQLKVKVLK